MVVKSKGEVGSWERVVECRLSCINLMINLLHGSILCETVQSDSVTLRYVLNETGVSLTVVVTCWFFVIVLVW